MPLDTFANWKECLRAIVVLEAFYSDYRGNVEELLDGSEITHYDYRPGSWPPSWLIAERPGRVDIYINGTSNAWQLWPHAHGAIGTSYRGGVVHSGMLFAGRTMYNELIQLIPGIVDDERQVTFYGHSYGSGASQVIADLLVESGRDGSKTRVLAYASPKVWSDGVGEAPYESEIIMTRSDPVPTQPLERMSVLYWTNPVWDIWVPTLQPFETWRHRVDPHIMTWSGRVTRDWFDASEIATGEPWRDGLILGYHFYESYLDFLERVQILNKWNHDDESQTILFIRGLNNPIENLPKRVPETTWLPGVPPVEAPIPSVFTSFGSNGSGSVLNVIECKAYFRQGLYGWSETHTYKSPTNQVPTLEEAQTAFEKYLSDRASAFAPNLTYGTQWEIYAARYTRNGESGESWVDWSPTITLTVGKVGNSTAGAIEHAFVGAGVRLFTANASTARDILIRPLPPTESADASGKTLTNNHIWAIVDGLMAKYIAQGCWCVKGLDKTKPVKKVTDVATGNLPQGECYLTVANHGYLRGMEVKVKSGKPVHKSVRGRHQILAVNDANTIHIRVGKPVVSGPSLLKISEVDYSYELINSTLKRRIQKRDTGRPIALGRGRR